MDEITMTAKMDDGTTVYVSPMHDQTYHEYVENDTLGGSCGYFIARECGETFEVLAKAASLDAARAIFGMLTSRRLIG